MNDNKKFEKKGHEIIDLLSDNENDVCKEKGGDEADCVIVGGDNGSDIIFVAKIDDDDDTSHRLAQKNSGSAGSWSNSRKINNTKKETENPTENMLQITKTKKRTKQESHRNRYICDEGGLLQPISPNNKKLQTGLVFEEDTAAFDNGGGGDCGGGNSSSNDGKRQRQGKKASSSFDHSSSRIDEKEGKITNILTAESYVKQQNELLKYNNNQRPILYHDDDFETVPSSIEGIHNHGKVPKCRCSPPQECQISYSKKEGANKNRPYYHCKKQCKGSRCKYFKWAFVSERVHWYRFGLHNDHILVRPTTGFSADDLLQGKVGDCWFLSALAVIAERPDLIMRLFGVNGNRESYSVPVLNEYGIAEITLFIDGFWKKVIIDNFLPCIVDSKEENDLDRAIKNSLIQTTNNIRNNSTNRKKVAAASSKYGIEFPISNEKTVDEMSSSKYNPYALTEKNERVLRDTWDFLQQDQYKKDGPFAQRQNGNNNNNPSIIRRKLQRSVTTRDLAYSKAKGVRNILFKKNRKKKNFSLSHTHTLSVDHIFNNFFLFLFWNFLPPSVLHSSNLKESALGAIFGKGVCEMSRLLSSYIWRSYS